MSTFTDAKSFRYYLRDGEKDLTTERIDPQTSAYPDTVRVGHVTGVVLANKTIVNYDEDCVDSVGGKNILLRNCSLSPKGRNGITVKGASEGFTAEGLTFNSHGRECDVELGAFDNGWYPGRPPTRGTKLTGFGSADIRKVLIKVWDAEDPVVSFPHVIVRIPKWKWFPYCLFRYVWLRAENLYRRLRKMHLIDVTAYRPGTLQPL